MMRSVKGFDMEYRLINQYAQQQAENLLKNWLPNGHLGQGQHGRYYSTKNPTRDDKQASFTVWIADGNWKDHATGDSGGDYISLYAYLNQLNQGDAAQTLAREFGIEIKQTSRKKQPPRPEAHKRLGKPSKVWTYHNKAGQEVFWVYRFDIGDGQKDFRPLHWTGRQWDWRDPPGKLPLYNLHLFTKNKSLLFCEGEKAADAAKNFFPDHIPTTTAHGAQSPAKTDFSPCRDREIFIWPDHDEAGQKYTNTIAQLALSAGATAIFILEVPSDMPTKWDAADADDSTPVQQWPRHAWKPEEPTITTTGTRLSTEQTTPALNALAQSNIPPRLFTREGQLMRLSIVPSNQALNTQTLKLVPVDSGCLRYELERAICWMRRDRQGNLVPTAPPDLVAQDILAMPDYPMFPRLERTITAPCVVQGGRVIDKIGYDKDTGIFYFQTEPLDIPTVDPTPIHLKKAKDLIDEWLVDFPFTDQASKTHAIALLILPFVRGLIDGVTPLHFITAPSQRTGKSLLSEILCSVFNPLISATTVPEGRDSDDEWRKKITSALLAQSTHIWFDNIKGLIDSANLEAALTSHSITARLLGTNREATLKNDKIWVATGNNAELSSDMTGRTVEIRLDANMENPSERSNFKHLDIRVWTKQHRGELIAAVLTLVRWWLKQGSPKPKDVPVLGGFEQWHSIVGGILQAVEIPGFLSNRREMVQRVNDVDVVFRDFVKGWFEAFDSRPTRPKDLHPIAKEADVFEAALWAKDEAAENKRLGRWLTKNADRVIAGFKIQKTKDNATGRNAYRLQQVTAI